VGADSGAVVAAGDSVVIGIAIGAPLGVDPVGGKVRFGLDSRLAPLQQKSTTFA
jgi:hypothetical protein